MALPDDLSTLKVTELKAELKKRGLAVAGLKKELVERLNDAIAAENAEQEAEEEVVEEEEEEEEAAVAEEATQEKEAEKKVDDDDGGDEKSDDKDEGDQADAKEAVVTKPEEVTAEPVEESKDKDDDEKAPVIEETKEDEADKVEEPVAAAAPPADKEQDTSMQDAPAQQKEEESAEDVKDDEKMDEAPAPAPETKEEKPAEGSSKTVSELQPTVETAAPTPMPRHEQPKSKENAIEEPTPAASAAATATATPIPGGSGSAPERQMTDADSSAETDVRKRKRRSKSPSLHESDVEAKKQRIREDKHGDRQEVVMEEAPPPRDRSRTPRSSDRRDRSRTRSKTRSRSRSRTPRGRDDRTRSRTRSPTRSRSRERSRGVIHGRGGAVDRSRSPMSRHSRSPSPPTRQRGSITTNAKDARFKGLFKDDAQAGGQGAEATAASPTRSGDDSDDGVEPAQHAASRAIYISELVRPLQESQLRTHLTSLASKSNNPDVMVTLYLDQIKTHCFAVFDSVQACSRVRNGIHNKIWPHEKNRKPLFADFVPENKVAEWIDIERHERGKRFAVAYRPAAPTSNDDDNDEDTDRRIEAVLEEVLPGGSTRRTVPVSGDASSVPRGRAPSDAPLGPRNPHVSGRLIQPAATNTPPGVKVVSLDELFKCTKTKPKLYYKPVSESVAKERLATKDYHKEALVAAAATRKGEFEFGRSRKRKNRGYGGGGGGGDSWSGKDRDWDRDWVRDGGRGDRRREGKRRR